VSRIEAIMIKSYYVCPQCCAIEILTDLVPPFHKHEEMVGLIKNKYFKEAKSISIKIRYGRKGPYGYRSKSDYKQGSNGNNSVNNKCDSL